MKQLSKIFAAVVMVMAMAACDGQIPEVPTPTPNNGILFSITATPSGGFTKATDTAFEQGDAVGVFGFKADLSVWLDNAKFTKAESGFKSDKEYYWYEGNEVGRIIGIYPYNTNYSSAKLITEGVEFCVKSDQRTHAGYTASDLMGAVREVAPTKESVVLEFNHLLSKIVIDINNQTSNEIAEVMVSGVKGNYKFSLASDEVSGGEGTIKAGKLATPSEGYTDTYVLIIPPQTVAPKLVMTTTDQKQYTYNATEEVEFGMGMVRHIMATISEESISTEFDAIVNDWSADEDVEFSQSGDNENPDQPEVPGDVTPIADVLAMGVGTTIESAVIEGVVISNMELNNLTSKKGLYIQDASAGVQFYLASNHEFAFGDQVKIDLSGAVVDEYNDAVQISGVALEKITKLSSGNVVEPRLVSIEDFLANKYESQYVAIAGVQVAEADLSKTWVMDGSHTSITIEDVNGNNFVVFSSKYATYGAQTVAQGSGMLKGIAGLNKGKVQIIFAQESDFAGLTNARLGEVEQPVVGDMTVNPLWSAEYVPEFYDEESGETYKDLIHMVSTDENNGFFFEFLPEDYFQSTVAPDVYGYVKNTADYLAQNLEEVNATNGTDWDFTAYTYYKYGLYDMHWIMNPGKWRAVMWGMTTEGEVTGLYYISDMVEVIDPATPEYLAWLGTYKLVSGDEEGNAITSIITISRNVANESFWIEGWNGISNRVAVTFNPTGDESGEGALVLYPQTILEDTYIGETHLTKIFFGGLAILESGYVLFETEDLPMAEIHWLMEGETHFAVISPNIYSVGEELTARVSQIGFLGVLDDGNITGVTAEIHTFQEGSGLTMLRQNPEEQPSAVARKHNPFEYGNNGAAKRLDQVRRVNQPVGNYVVGGKKFSAVNF